MIYDKIKILRENKKMTQTDLANKLKITRASVNAWEMGISTPSTKYIIELAKIFGVSTDYLLGTEARKTINIDGLSDREVKIISELIDHFKKNK